MFEVLRFDFGSHEVGAGNHHRREELVFEGNPFKALLEGFGVVALCRYVVGGVAHIFIVYAGVAFLEDASLLVAPHVLVPLHLYCGHAWGYYTFHALLHHIHLHYI